MIPLMLMLPVILESDPKYDHKNSLISSKRPPPIRRKHNRPGIFKIMAIVSIGDQMRSNIT